MSIGWALNCTVALQYGRVAYIQYNLAGQQFTVVVLALVAATNMDWNASPRFTIDYTLTLAKSRDNQTPVKITISTTGMG